MILGTNEYQNPVKNWAMKLMCMDLNVERLARKLPTTSMP